MSGEAYIASDDSALLRSALKGRSGSACLEIGTGNAGALVELSTRFELAVGTDIVRPSMSDWKEAGIQVVVADGASCFRARSFDLVAFNPPYLAEAIQLDRTVEGGEELAIPKKFLREALECVKTEGEVVFLLNDDAVVGDFERTCSESGFELLRLKSERLFYEELTVFAARRGQSRH